MKKRLELLLRDNHVLNAHVMNNFNNLKLTALIFPFLLLLLIAVYFFSNDAFTVEAYVQSQKDFFIYLNSNLSKFPSLQFSTIETICFSSG